MYAVDYRCDKTDVSVSHAGGTTVFPLYVIVRNENTCKHGYDINFKSFPLSDSLVNIRGLFI